ncbi:hypothetical protein JYT74_00300 [Crocinitomix catalasitica]|nr:hypothetical protein [Crocinitomix catalasitica]
MKKRYRMPNPCSERWNEMTPTEKGAVCEVCATEVFDFTHQSPEEIKEFLKSRSGIRTCAKVEQSQMDMMNTNYHIWNNQSASVFRSKFLYACLMVFGFTLFTGCGSAEEEELPVGIIGDYEDHIEVGMVEADSTYYVEDTLNEDEDIKVDEIDINSKEAEHIKVGIIEKMPEDGD